MSDTKQKLTSSLHSSYPEITCKVEALIPSTNSSYIARQNNCDLQKQNQQENAIFSLFHLYHCNTRV